MKEEDVRACILDPIFKKLGYDFGAENYVERERHLKYPYTQVGHKGRKDIPVGASDYICGIDGRRGTFAVEAKRGSHTICQADVEQAHSYAAHPEIGAEFYIISNGIEFRVYKTLGGLKAPPIISVINSDLENDFHKIEALLSPDSLLKHSAAEYDTGLPLAPSLGSTHEVTNGFIRIQSYNLTFDCHPQHPFLQHIEATGILKKPLAELEQMINCKQPVESGVVERDKKGRVHAELKFGAYRPDVEHNMSAMGIQNLTFFTNDETISEDSEKPSVFETLTLKSLPQGTLIIPGIKRQLEPLGLNMDIEILYRAYGHIDGHEFKGIFEGHSIFSMPNHNEPIPNFITESTGDFLVTLSKN